ncbi:MAG: fructose-1,6-bisphosphate aldolase, partial [Pseudomonadota bacterium]|nr:fructose-1,6-bisphosphate aldolase [Pseudomonadota bacterium]
KPAQDAMEALCRDRFERFGTAGQAHKIKPVALADMARFYANGQLAPKISA